MSDQSDKNEQKEDPQKTGTQKGVLEVLESVSKIIAAVAIPIAIAVGSWWIQSSQNTQSVSKDYVNMALSLTPSENKDGP